MKLGMEEEGIREEKHRVGITTEGERLLDLG